LLIAALALTQIAPAKVGDTAKGNTLVDGKGMTLYTFDKDAGRKPDAPQGICRQNYLAQS